MIKEYAPVLIITLNRFEKLKLCVESLRDNHLAKQTDLFIALDYPSKPEHFPGYEKIVDFLEGLNGFNSINIIKRSENFGIVKNYLTAKNELFEKYDAVIFSEDDNEFSTDFLNFMNKCLRQYKDDRTIFSISGYNYPVIMPSNYNLQVYKWVGHSAWGFGIWKDRWENISWDEQKIASVTKKFLKQYSRVYDYIRIANHYFSSALTIAIDRKINGDGFINLYQFENNYHSIFPVESRVKNHGHDGTGRSEANIVDSPYLQQSLYSGDSNYEIPLIVPEDKQINKILKKHFQVPLINLIRSSIKLVMFNLGIIFK
ncbi:MAG: hypothetical protein EOO43_09340 [Flavobacterium sp.]|nr:MAG: hypothetical protein EOO43_09340 [Flavobacterium sp.]